MPQLKTSHKVTGAIAGTVMLAVPVVAQFEGLWLTAKPDRLAHGIPTVCYGETEGVRLGDTYTKQQCQFMLANKLPRYLNEIDRCIKVPVSDRTRAAYLSFAYNVGSGAFCGSTSLKLLNRGQDEASCRALAPYNRSAGQFRQGLANRRSKEIAMCLEGLKEPKRLIGPDAVEKTFKHAEAVNPKIAAEPTPVLPPKLTFWQKLMNWFWSK
ncbi:lysozyme [Bradyrhizobium sp. KB893862 SZCCT0404]|uniref:lysozyme n=1 Tax=Bradyrhizobium sp. KB893862 SZCCT0404 TaxID=2807672 RepID=UPI001BA56AE3|nr:lysozyme [Bradyrhizobium sp. KB893862 SZCCT0404]MBR1173904.1 lysozyme [Bradyrhizobium sp. KB893862 SZCCT0404]